MWKMSKVFTKNKNLKNVYNFCILLYKLGVVMINKTYTLTS